MTTGAKAFRVKRAEDNVLRLAREWSRANAAWMNSPGVTDPEQVEEQKLFEAQRGLRKRLDAAAHELVAVEAEP
jgi:hypothetical protein